MNPKLLKHINSFNKHLKLSKNQRYASLLLQLFNALPSSDAIQTLSQLVRKNDWAGVSELGDSMSKQKYEDATEHFVGNQIASLIRKFPRPIPGINPKESAELKFRSSEHKCRRVNQRFRLYERLRSPHAASLERMRSFCAYVLETGGLTPFQATFDKCNFGPGANLGVHGNATNLGRKLLAESWTVTANAYDYAIGALMSDSHIFELHSVEREYLLPDGSKYKVHSVDPEETRRSIVNRIKVVNNNKIAFVPKTALTDRVIAVEPLLNGYLQKGVDDFIRNRLKRIGINLQDQSLNQEMARLGSLDDSPEGFVTIDLSSASDSISIGLVRSLLPAEWFSYLNSLRPRFGTIGSKDIYYHKFCSMGNGFCFPLETLLFTAACVSVGCGKAGTDFSVYGDDIIVRKRYAANLIALLGVMGFAVNKRKTFLEGPFRESCGADWFGGEDVRPFILDFELDNLSSLFKFVNLTQRNERTTSFFSALRDTIYFSIPQNMRFSRPYKGNEDTCMHVELDRFLSTSFARWNRHLQCWGWTELATKPKADSALWLHDRYHTVLMKGALAGCSSTKPFTLRRKTKTDIRKVAYGGTHSTWVPLVQQEDGLISRLNAALSR